MSMSVLYPSRRIGVASDVRPSVRPACRPHFVSGAELGSLCEKACEKVIPVDEMSQVKRRISKSGRDIAGLQYL